MFTGIIEASATLVDLVEEGSNLRLVLESPVAAELRVDQSVAHDGVCLTVERLPAGQTYEVVAIQETLHRTTLGQLHRGHRFNLERCLMAGARLDGHFVQGHVDAVLKVLRLEDRNGSWWLEVELPPERAALVVPKGSIALNGVSLTVAQLEADRLAVAIIPYTWQHTNLSQLKPGSPLNVEFDVLGKYVLRAMGQPPQAQAGWALT